ncbi:MAG: hypothetical protein JNL82_15095 [Myxococcales bacterium]|nr:hypothetical protein [Myxococcales bacterium]
MTDHAITTWRAATVVDDEPRVRRPWSLIGGAFAVLLAVDGALALALPAREAAPLAFDGAASARAELAAAAAAEQEAWLLVGDSVLAGDVMAGKVAGWQRERVVDHLQRELGGGEARMFQVALDGLLPVDLLQVVRALDRVDPGGDVGLVVELSPRFFSRSYAEAAACTRPWLCELGPETIDGDGAVRWDNLVLGALADVRDAAASVTPVYRHRERIGAIGPEPTRLLTARESEDDALSGRARLLAHYRDPALGPDSVQVAALTEVMRRVRGVGRRAVFFTTPLEDGFAAQARGGADDGAYTAALSRIVEGDGADDAVALVPLDHPGFHAQMFLDHCHLTPEGNRRLAINLLHAMGLPLRTRPAAGELVYAEDVDRTLVGRAETGHADGPAWSALFGANARGIAVAPGGRRVVVADTHNHALRELVGDLYSVRTLAGAAGERGFVDGPVPEARLQRPRAPWILGDAVYFADQNGTQLRRVQGGVVSTLALRGKRWTDITQIVGHNQDLLVVDRGRRVVRVNVTTGATRVVARASGAASIAAVTSASDGRVWVAERGGKIWSGHITRPFVIGRDPHEARLVFDDAGKAYLPQRRGQLFPLPYKEVRLDRPFALSYLPRYDALLVADDARAREPVEDYHERTQLRLLSLKEKKMYPWIHGEVLSSSTYWNEHAEAYASTLHVGSMAVEPESAAVVWLEHDRSRLLWLSDGVWALAKVSHTANFTFARTRDLFGNEAGIRAQDRFRPDLWLPTRVERVPRRGPYTGLVVTSSMGAMSQSLGPYALTRRLERHLQEDLGRMGVRFDLVHRAYSQPSFDRVIDAVDLYTAQSGRPDVILLEIHNFRRRFFAADVGDADIRDGLAALQTYAQRSDALLLLFDNSGLIATEHDGLRATPEVVERAKRIARSMDIAVIELTDELLPRSLHEGVWGSPPMKGSHGIPHAIDATALLLAERAAPAIARHLGPGRVPALLSPGGVEAVDPAASLGGAFAARAVDWTAALPRVPGEAIQRQRGAGAVELFVDLEVVLGKRRTVDRAALERLALASVYTTFVVDGSYADAARVNVRLAWFKRRDEYGLGVQGGAEVALRASYDRAELVAAIDRALAGE